MGDEDLPRPTTFADNEALGELDDEYMDTEILEIEEEQKPFDI